MDHVTTMKANITATTIPTSNGNTDNTLVIIIASTAGGVALFIFVVMVIIFIKRKSRKSNQRTLNSENDFGSRSFRARLEDLMQNMKRQNYTPKYKSKTRKNRTESNVRFLSNDSNPENCFDEDSTVAKMHYYPEVDQPIKKEKLDVEMDIEKDNNSYEVIINDDNKSDNGYYETLNHVKACDNSIYDVPDQIEKQDQITNFEGYEVTYIEHD